MAARSPAPAARSRGLDLLRALAVLLTLGAHCPPCRPEESRWLHALGGAWWRGGWVGVDLFFVLSGFLVAGLLLEEHRRRGTVSAGRFLARRGFKIYPAFWALLGATVTLGWLRGKPPDLSASLAELFFVQNYVPGLWLHTWSLAVEEHFYLLLAAVMALLAARGPAADRFRALPWVAAGAMALCLALRLALPWDAPYDPYRQQYPTHLRVDALLAGAALAWVRHARPGGWSVLARRRGMLALAGAFAFVPAFVWPVNEGAYLRTVGLSIHTLGAVGLVAAVSTWEPPRDRLTSALARAGENSYSIYLWHLPVLVWAVPLLSARLGGGAVAWVVTTLAYIAGSAAVGFAAAAVIERPALRLRDRWFPARAPAPRV